MTPRTQLRLIVGVPLLFAIVGLALIVISIATRRYWSPTPGALLGSIVLLCNGIAARQLWRATRTAPTLLAVAGVSVFGAVFALPWLFPLVHASSEPPSFLGEYRYQTALLLIAVLVVVATWLARRLLRGIALYRRAELDRS